MVCGWAVNLGIQFRKRGGVNSCGMDVASPADGKVLMEAFVGDHAAAMKRMTSCPCRLLLASVVFAGNGCVGMAHSHCVCCRDHPGKYYRATRLDLKFIRQSPCLTPLILALDLPFALVYESLEAPWIKFGGYDPRPRMDETNRSAESRSKVAAPAKSIPDLAVDSQLQEPPHPCLTAGSRPPGRGREP